MQMFANLELSSMDRDQRLVDLTICLFIDFNQRQQVTGMSVWPEIRPSVATRI